MSSERLAGIACLYKTSFCSSLASTSIFTGGEEGSSARCDTASTMSSRGDQGSTSSRLAGCSAETGLAAGSRSIKTTISGGADCSRLGSSADCSGSGSVAEGTLRSGSDRVAGETGGVGLGRDLGDSVSTATKTATPMASNHATVRGESSKRPQRERRCGVGNKILSARRFASSWKR